MPKTKTRTVVCSAPIRLDLTALEWAMLRAAVDAGTLNGAYLEPSPARARLESLRLVAPMRDPYSVMTWRKATRKGRAAVARLKRELDRGLHNGRILKG